MPNLVATSYSVSDRWKAYTFLKRRERERTGREGHLVGRNWEEKREGGKTDRSWKKNN